MKSASKIGSSTSFAAICATRSRTVGIPSGRFLRLPSECTDAAPPAAGTRLLAARAELFQEALDPALLDVADRLASTPAAPRLRLTRFHASHRTSLL